MIKLLMTLILGFGIFFYSISYNVIPFVKNECSCEGFLCACDIECDEGEQPNCDCALVSCECECYDDSGVIIQGPKPGVIISAKQEENSKELERFLSNQNNSELKVLSSMIKECRESIVKKDMKLYRDISKKTEKYIDNLNEENRTILFKRLKKIKNKK